jgi:hypothetical protein
MLSKQFKISIMKRIVILSVTAFLAVTGMNAQVQKTGIAQTSETKKEVKAERKALRKLEGNNVSAVAKNNFAQQFGKAANVVWKRIDTFDEAAFNLDGNAMKAFYDFEGNLVGTTFKVAFTDLPSKGQQEIKSKYKDYTPGSVIMFDDNEANDTDMLLYGVQFDDSDNYFIEMVKGSQKIILRVNPAGSVSLFQQI